MKTYKKLHLFDAQVPGLKNKMNESNSITPGSSIINPIDTPIGRLGMMTVSFQYLYSKILYIKNS